jgi:hypothetical protein
LLAHLPDDSALDPELPDWIESPTRIMAANDAAQGFGINPEPIEQGFLVIGSCPNGDPVVVQVRAPGLPVFYLSHEELHDRPLTQIMRKIADSFAAFTEALLDKGSGMPLDYWDTRRT